MVEYDEDGIPKSPEFYRKVLECFSDGEKHKKRDIEDCVLRKFNLNEHHKQIRTSGGGKRKTYERTGRAVTHFYQYKFLDRDLEENEYWITELGRSELEKGYENMSKSYLKNFPTRDEEEQYITLETKYEIVDRWKSSEELENFVTNAYKSENSTPLLLFDIGDAKYSEFFCNNIGNYDFIFIKEDFEKYMVDIKNVFLNPEDETIDKNEMGNIYSDSLLRLKEYDKVEKLKMKLDSRDESNFYIKPVGLSKYYELLKKIMIPENSHLSILKLKNENEILYYFKISADNLDEIDISYKNFDRNKIFFGAPGTGKSFQLNKDRKTLICYDDDYERVTFHPDYSYAQFVGTYKPVPKEEDGKKTISYEYVAGPFMRVLSKAIENSRSSYPRPFLLVIEEINRANMAAVFGDVFQLLDRDKEDNSQYPINLSKEMKDYLEEKIHYDLDYIKIPSNMFIWAMNSADQGVFPMDTAFKRRWDFEYIDIDNEQEKIRDITFQVNNEVINWNNLRKSINNFLLKNNINEDKLLGPFFVSNIEEFKNNPSKDFKEVFKSKVLMYLYEDGAKSIKNLLFEPIAKENLSYSLICDKFNSKGINIFKKEIKDFYEELNSTE